MFPSVKENDRVLSGAIKSAYPLSINLADVGNPLGQGIARHLVSKLISELSGFSNGSLDGGSSIGDGSGHDTAH